MDSGNTHWYGRIPAPEQSIDRFLLALLLCIWFLFYVASDKHPGSRQHERVEDVILNTDPFDDSSEQGASLITNLDSPGENGGLDSERPVRHRVYGYYLTLATMIKNQRRWLREWIEFNIMMGVDHFIIYDNNSTDLPLDILQFYIDHKVMTYIKWPPETVPPPEGPFETALEEYQYNWFRDTLETCLDNTWQIHKAVPCQLAAFSDAIRRTKGGTSRWLGIWDVVEYIFPREQSFYRTISGLLRRKYADNDRVLIHGSIFGTSGHVEHAAQKQPGSDMPALVTEEYVYRGALDGISCVKNHAVSNCRRRKSLGRSGAIRGSGSSWEGNAGDI